MADLPQLIPTVENQTIQQKDLLTALVSNEMAFETMLKHALSVTKDSDWSDQGGKPYLEVSGSLKIALRFGMSIKFDRDEKGNARLDREEFTDEYGTFYVYTMWGTAELCGRAFPSIGTATTRDDFLGWKYEGHGEGRSKKPKPLYEVIENVKKKALANFYGNAIKNALGFKGFTWDDLSKYGIYAEGKKQVAFGSKKEPQKSESHTQGESKPYWPWKDSICARVGKHFEAEFLKFHGMKPGKTEGVFLAKATPELQDALEEQFNAVEKAHAS